MADQRKEANKSIAFAKLTNCPTSPRKMRLVVDLVRGLEVEKALANLEDLAQKKHLSMLRNCCFQRLPTGKRKTKMQASKMRVCL